MYRLHICTIRYMYTYHAIISGVVMVGKYMRYFHVPLTGPRFCCSFTFSHCIFRLALHDDFSHFGLLGFWGALDWSCNWCCRLLSDFGIDHWGAHNWYLCNPFLRSSHLRNGLFRGSSLNTLVHGWIRRFETSWVAYLVTHAIQHVVNM